MAWWESDPLDSGGPAVAEAPASSNWWGADPVATEPDVNPKRSDADILAKIQSDSDASFAQQGLPSLGPSPDAPATPYQQPPAVEQPSAEPSALDTMRANQARLAQQLGRAPTNEEIYQANLQKGAEADAEVNPRGAISGSLPYRTVESAAYNIGGKGDSLYFGLVGKIANALGADGIANFADQTRNAMQGTMNQEAAVQDLNDKKSWVGTKAAGLLREGGATILEAEAVAPFGGIPAVAVWFGTTTADRQMAAGRPVEEALTHGAIDAAWTAAGGKILGSGLGKLAGEENAGIGSKAAGWLSQKLHLPSWGEGAIEGTGGQVAQGMGQGASHYLADVGFGKREFNRDDLIRSMTETIPSSLVVGIGSMGLKAMIGKTADVIQQRHRELPTVAKAIEEAGNAPPEVAKSLLDQAIENTKAPSRREFGKATGDHKTSEIYREAYVDELRRMNQELQGSSEPRPEQTDIGQNDLPPQLPQRAQEFLDTGEFSPRPESSPPPQSVSVETPAATESAPPAATEAPAPDFLNEEHGYVDDQGWWVDTTPAAERTPPTEKEVGRLKRDVAKVRRRDALPDGFDELDHHDQRYILDEAAQRQKIDNQYQADLREQYKMVFGDGKRQGAASARAAKIAARGGDETFIRNYDDITEKLRDPEYADLASVVEKNGLVPTQAGGAKQFADTPIDDYIAQVHHEHQTAKEQEVTSSGARGIAPEDQGAPSERSGDGGIGVESPAPRPQEAPQAEQVAPFALSREASPPAPTKFENTTAKQPDLIPDLWRDALPGQQGLWDGPPPPRHGTAVGPLAIGLNPHVIRAVRAGMKAVRSVYDAIGERKEFHDFRRTILAYSARAQQSYQEIDNFTRELKRSVPDPATRAAMADWREAGGDDALLAQRAAQSKGELAKGYEAARNLTPEQKALADEYGKKVEELRQRALKVGINIDERPNYVTHIATQNALARLFFGKKLDASVKWAKERTHETFFHGEQAGVTYKTKDLSDLYAKYAHDINHAVNSKLLVAEMTKGTAKDGRPLIAPADGMVSVVDDPKSGASPIFVLPGMPPKGAEGYESLNQPALREWTWKAADENGNPIFVKGELRVHPDVATHLNNILGESAIRKMFSSPSETAATAATKAVSKFLVDDARQYGKATLFGFLQPFHQVTEGQHASLFHHVNPVGVAKPDLINDPVAIRAAQHGLMLAPDRISAGTFIEGSGGDSNKNLTTLALRGAGKLLGKAGSIGKAAGKAPTALADAADTYQHYLFHDYIPGLKLKTYNELLGRNTKRYAADIQAGKVSLDDVEYVTATQVNASYGHLNMTDIGRSPTLQHLMQITMMAPDFTEARARFAGQGVKGVVDKSGREQLKALAIGAATIYGATRVINKLVDDDWHNDHPFEVVVGNRRYGMRNVPEDMWRAATDSWKFTAGRASPVAKTGLELLTQTNYRGEHTTAGETLTNAIAGIVPINLQPLTRPLSQEGRNKDTSLFEQALSAVGVNVFRYSPTTKIYDMADEWKKKNSEDYGIAPDNTVYAASKYRQLRYALEDSDNDKAAREIDNLLKSEKISPHKLTQRVKQSLTGDFTGSAKTDKAFRNSLDEKDKALFDAAKERQKLLVKRYLAVKRQTAPGPTPAPVAALQSTP